MHIKKTEAQTGEDVVTVIHCTNPLATGSGVPLRAQAFLFQDLNTSPPF